jgi:predicted DNA binding CopG/RHH family protein
MNTVINQKEFNAQTEKWENGELGRDEAYVQRAPKSSQTDDALALQMISIRLPKDLIETFKMIGAVHSIGYQPLMRTALQRFADGELKMFGKDYVNQLLAQGKASQGDEEPLRKVA